MELLSQANLLIAIAAPIALIVVINAVLQRGNEIRPLFDDPTSSVPAVAPTRIDPVAAYIEAGSTEAANDDLHERAA